MRKIVVTVFYFYCLPYVLVKVVIVVATQYFIRDSMNGIRYIFAFPFAHIFIFILMSDRNIYSSPFQKSKVE